MGANLRSHQEARPRGASLAEGPAGEGDRTGWANTEFRTYEFLDSHGDDDTADLEGYALDGDNASLVETLESRRRRGKDGPAPTREQQRVFYKLGLQGWDDQGLQLSVEEREAARMPQGKEAQEASSLDELIHAWHGWGRYTNGPLAGRVDDALSRPANEHEDGDGDVDSQPPVRRDACRPDEQRFLAGERSVVKRQWCNADGAGGVNREEDPSTTDAVAGLRAICSYTLTEDVIAKRSLERGAVAQSP
ncbi:hypothetical protein VTN02DRAFT_523 [Thermoascus thermophilus]